MKKRAIYRNQAIRAHDQSPEITDPGEGALDFPPPAISPRLSAILQFDKTSCSHNFYFELSHNRVFNGYPQ
jgi:hypothetical protein